MNLSKYFATVAILLGQLVFTSSAMAAAGLCESGVVDLIGDVSPSTALDVNAYSQPNARLLRDYISHLGLGFESAIQGLSKGQTYFDGGSGFGVVAAQVASLKPGVKAIAANLQNFWQQLFDSTQAHRGGDVLQKLGEAVGEKLTGLQAAKSKLQQLATQGFDYRVGDVRVTLERMIENNERIDLYSDVFGGYAYLANRVQLLELIYRSLAENGRAYILSQDQIAAYREIDRLYHRVRIKGPEGNIEMVSFEKYLRQLNDPAIEFVGRFPETIVIRKIPGRDTLGLGLEMIPGTVEYSGGAAFPMAVEYRQVNVEE